MGGLRLCLAACWKRERAAEFRATARDKGKVLSGDWPDVLFSLNFSQCAWAWAREMERGKEEERRLLFQSQLEYYFGADRWNQGVAERVLGIVLSFFISLFETPLHSFHKWMWLLSTSCIMNIVSILNGQLSMTFCDQWMNSHDVFFYQGYLEVAHAYHCFIEKNVKVMQHVMGTRF